MSQTLGQLATAAFALKENKETGKGLSANDFTNAYKGKLDNIPAIPTTAGNYVLAVAVDNNTATYSWVAVSSLSGVTF